MQKLTPYETTLSTRALPRIWGVLGLLLLTATALPWAAWGWGDEGHEAINRVAAQKLPPVIPDFLRSAVAEIAYLGPEPDRWRSDSEPALKGAQSAEHYLNFERVGDLRQFPPTRYEFYRYLERKRASAGAKADDYLPENVGLQPYAAVENYERLKTAFREYRILRAGSQPTRAAQQTVVYYAGLLGHYVADASNPLHTTIHFNGWTGPNPNGYTNSKDVHSKVESVFVRNNFQQLPFPELVGQPARLQDPLRDYVSYMDRSFRLVEELYRIEKRGGFNDQGTAEGREFIRRRLAAGSQMLLNLWYTAWLESGIGIASSIPATSSR